MKKSTDRERALDKAADKAVVEALVAAYKDICEYKLENPRSNLAVRVIAACRELSAALHRTKAASAAALQSGAGMASAPNQSVKSAMQRVFDAQQQALDAAWEVTSVLQECKVIHPESAVAVQLVESMLEAADAHKQLEAVSKGHLKAT